MYRSQCNSKIGVLGSTFFTLTKHSYLNALKNEEGLSTIEVSPYLANYVAGKGADENECYAWWELDYVSIATHNLLTLSVLIMRIFTIPVVYDADSIPSTHLQFSLGCSVVEPAGSTHYRVRSHGAQI